MGVGRLVPTRARRRTARRRLRGLVFAARLRLRGGRAGRRLQLDGGVLVRNGLHAGIRLGDDVYLGRGVVLDIDPGAVLEIGDRAKVMHYSVVAASERVEIGPDTQVAEHCSVRDTDHGMAVGMPMAAQRRVSPVRIGRDVWLARGVAVLRGVTIGDGAVVAANAVVRSDVAPLSLVGGVPARVLREHR